MDEHRGIPEQHRLSLAYNDLTKVPYDIVTKYGNSVIEMDLSHNKISDLRFLMDFPRLQSVVLDHNQITCQVKIPKAPHIQTLWVNHNKIRNLGLFITTLIQSCPNLRILSMMNNEAAPSFFNGGTYQQYMDYRYFVMSSLPKLQVLDYSNITPEERSEARRLYPVSIVEAKKKKKRKKTRASAS